jgi:hypothetical protein
MLLCIQTLPTYDERYALPVKRKLEDTLKRVVLMILLDPLLCLIENIAGLHPSHL